MKRGSQRYSFGYGRELSFRSFIVALLVLAWARASLSTKATASRPRSSGPEGTLLFIKPRRGEVWRQRIEPLVTQEENEES